MSATDKLADIGRSIIGSPKKAILIFGQVLTDSDLSSVSKAAKSSANVAEKTKQCLESGASTVTGGAELSPPQVLEVQYNPASIQFSANAQSVRVNGLQNNVDNSVINQITRPPSVSMQVDLIFDDVNVKDAFMSEKFRLSAGDIVADVAAVANAFMGGYSVQKQSNGLLSATHHETNRFVTFQWADMVFSGELMSVEVKYTMFSVSGRPIRSVVTLRIMQMIASTADSRTWNQKKFDECFNNKQNRSIGQAVGNLLNISGF